MLRWLTAGESHGPGLVAVLEGLPAHVRVTSDDIVDALARRRLGYGRGARMKFEQDQVDVIGGLRHGRTLGSPIAIRVGNTEWPKWDKVMAADPVDEAELEALARNAALTRPRPGHADLVGMQKYDFTEARPILERASARETAARVALGAVVHGLPPGLGSHVHWDRRLDARLAGALMGIQAIKGVEVGDGFALAADPGSLAHDEIVRTEEGIRRTSGRSGGTEGGMSTGEILRVRAAMKPIATVPRALRTVDVATGEAAVANHQRSDVCAVPAAGIVAEAMVALVLAEAVLEKFGGDSLGETRRNVEGYLAALRI